MSLLSSHPDETQSSVSNDKDLSVTKRHEILDSKTRENLLCRQRTTLVLIMIRLHRCKDIEQYSLCQVLY